MHARGKLIPNEIFTKNSTERNSFETISKISANNYEPIKKCFRPICLLDILFCVSLLTAKNLSDSRLYLGKISFSLAITAVQGSLRKHPHN